MDLGRATKVLDEFVSSDPRFSFSAIGQTGARIGVGRVRDVLFYDSQIGIVGVDEFTGDFGLLVTVKSRVVTFEVLDETFEKWSLAKAAEFETRNILLTNEFEVGARTLCLNMVLVPLAVGPKSVSQTFENLRAEIVELEEELSNKFVYEFGLHF